ncbi:hypothetical protein [Arthrobacter pityocampae]|uniref:hypothetical protein n=1 Tax=Arthrobacter pityocampae TaxID=547334 RepID=UPI003736727E
MRPIDENTLKALAGSRTGDELVCWVWYDGRLVFPEPLPVASWSLEWRGGDREKVQGSLSLDVKDPDGQLGPWLFDDPLGVGGARIQVLYRVGGAGDVRVGWYRVTGNATEESWAFRTIREDGYVLPDSDLPPNYRHIAVPLGSSVKVTAHELTVELDADEFLAPENPSTPTVISEVTRLVGDTVPVRFAGVTDENVPPDVVYEENRLEAIQDLLAMVGATYRMTGDGELECYVKDPAPVAVLAGGPSGVLINLTRSQSVDQVHNIGVVTSTRKDTQLIDDQVREAEVPVVGRYEIEAGPFRVGGPFGRRVVRNANPLMDSDAKAYKAAESLVLNRLASQTVDVSVQCLPNPAIQCGDRVTVEAPQSDGRLVPFAGEVVDMGLGGSGGRVNEMTLLVRCLLADIAAALKGHSIADRLTGTKPALTYDAINPARTYNDLNNASYAQLRSN